MSMHPKYSLSKDSIEILKSMERKAKEEYTFDSTALFSDISSMVQDITKNLNHKNIHGNVLSWHIDYQYDDTIESTSVPFRFNVEFKCKDKPLFDINIKIDRRGIAEIECGVLSSDIIDQKVPIDITVLDNSPDIKFKFIPSKEKATKSLYRLKSLFSITNRHPTKVTEYLKRVMYEIEEFLMLMLDNISPIQLRIN